MVQSQTYGSDRSATEQSNTLQGLQLDAHTLHKLKEQALRKARMLQAKVSTRYVMLAQTSLSACPPSATSRLTYQATGKKIHGKYYRLRGQHQRTWTKQSWRHMLDHDG